MFGFGPWEIGILLLVVLVVGGPTLLPRLGKILGGSIVGLRQGAVDLSEQLADGLSEQSKLPKGDDLESSDPKPEGRS